MPYYYYYYDPTYILVIIGVVLSLLASANVNRTFNRYSQIRSHTGLTGKEAAERILRMNGIYDVQVQYTRGNLTDHYDPRRKVLRLSDSTYQSASVAAVGVAAHECGHAIQHSVGYVPLKIRGALVPVANFGSSAAWPLVIIGLFMNGEIADILIRLGILLFCAALLFQIVTLPVEFNASRRGLRALENGGLLMQEELRDTKKVLRAAAMTYVAGVISSFLQLLRLLLISSASRDRDR